MSLFQSFLSLNFLNHKSKTILFSNKSFASIYQLYNNRSHNNSNSIKTRCLIISYNTSCINKFGNCLQNFFCSFKIHSKQRLHGKKKQRIKKQLQRIEIKFPDHKTNRLYTEQAKIAQIVSLIKRKTSTKNFIHSYTKFIMYMKQ